MKKTGFAVAVVTAFLIASVSALSVNLSFGYPTTNRVTITSPQNGTTINTHSVAVSFEVKAFYEIDYVGYRLDGGPLESISDLTYLKSEPATGIYYLPDVYYSGNLVLSNLDNGNHSVTIYQGTFYSDSFDENARSSLNFTVDSAPPKKDLSLKTTVVPDDYPTIQSAIDNSNEGDTVFVKRGVYKETLTIIKSISLIGEDRNSTVIDANKAQTQVILIHGDNITVANFSLGNNSVHTIKNSGDYYSYGEGEGIAVSYSHNVNIINNTIVECPRVGIYLHTSDFKTLETVFQPTIKVIGNKIFSCNTAIEIADINFFVANNTYANTNRGVIFEYTSIIAGIAGGPSNGTEFILSEWNFVQGNHEVTSASIPSPFPPASSTSSPTPTTNPTSSSSIPEFPSWIILPLLTLGTIAYVIAHKKGKQRIETREKGVGK